MSLQSVAYGLESLKEKYPPIWTAPDGRSIFAAYDMASGELTTGCIIRLLKDGKEKDVRFAGSSSVEEVERLIVEALEGM